MRDNGDFLLKVVERVEQGEHAMWYASDLFTDNMDFVLNAVRLDHHSFYSASARCRNDRQIIVTAVHQDAYMLLYGRLGQHRRIRPVE